MAFPVDGGAAARKIPAGIIGLGRIASLLEEDPLREKPCTHAGALSASGECALLCGADRDAARREQFASAWGAAVFADAGAMLDAFPCEIVVIATHPDSHLFYARLAAAKGARLIICEKPLAATLRDAARLAALSPRVKILVNHERRYAENYRAVKTLLDSGRLGSLCAVKAALCMGQGARLIDMLWHDGTHLADALAFLTGGELRHKTTWGAPLSAREGTAFFAGELRKGGAAVPVVIEAGAGRAPLIFEIELSLTRGRVRIGNGVREVWESVRAPYAAHYFALAKTEEESAEGSSKPTGYFTNMIADAAACVRDEARLPVSNAATALAATRYLNAVGKWR